MWALIVACCWVAIWIAFGPYAFVNCGVLSSWPSFSASAEARCNEAARNEFLGRQTEQTGEVFFLVAGRGGVHVMTTTISVSTLIQFANGVHARQIFPSWLGDVSSPVWPSLLRAATRSNRRES